MFYINQLDYPNLRYDHNMAHGGAPEGKNTAAAAACGPCCLLMMVENLTFSHLSLPECLQMSYDLEANMEPGTDLKILGKAVAEQFDLDFAMTDELSALVSHLQAGGMAVANSGGDREGYTGLFTHGGHYIAVLSVENDMVCILDPSYKEGKYEEEGRQGKAFVKEPFVYCSLDTLMKDCENRSPAFYLFKRRR